MQVKILFINTLKEKNNNSLRSNFHLDCRNSNKKKTKSNNIVHRSKFSSLWIAVRLSKAAFQDALHRPKISICNKCSDNRTAEHRRSAGRPRSDVLRPFSVDLRRPAVQSARLRRKKWLPTLLMWTLFLASPLTRTVLKDFCFSLKKKNNKKRCAKIMNSRANTKILISNHCKYLKRRRAHFSLFLRFVFLI